MVKSLHKNFNFDQSGWDKKYPGYSYAIVQTKRVKTKLYCPPLKQIIHPIKRFYRFTLQNPKVWKKFWSLVDLFWEHRKHKNYTSRRESFGVLWLPLWQNKYMSKLCQFGRSFQLLTALGCEICILRIRFTRQKIRIALLYKAHFDS